MILGKYCVLLDILEFLRLLHLLCLYTDICVFSVVIPYSFAVNFIGKKIYGLAGVSACLVYYFGFGSRYAPYCSP